MYSNNRIDKNIIEKSTTLRMSGYNTTLSPTIANEQEKKIKK